MKDVNASLAPALDGGLTILEHLSLTNEGAGFNEIAGILPQTKATVSRLLKTLVARNFVRKNMRDGKYQLSLKVVGLCRHLALPDSLGQAAAPILKKLSRETENTVAAFFWDGGAHTCVAKEDHPYSVNMQSVGEVFEDLSIKPWGWIVVGELIRQRRATLQSIQRGKRWKRRIEPEWVEFYLRNGYVYDDCFIHGDRGVRRLSSPVRGENGDVIGAVGVGGTILTLSDDKIEETAALCARAGLDVSEVWRDVLREVAATVHHGLEL